MKYFTIIDISKVNKLIAAKKVNEKIWSTFFHLLGENFKKKGEIRGKLGSPEEKCNLRLPHRHSFELFRTRIGLYLNNRQSTIFDNSRDFENFRFSVSPERSLFANKNCLLCIGYVVT